ncbi:hypothetical protein Vi05172_g3669 [Venturia inaequalis]|nr:hypothetical protein Vi05172_g3669 [Venturia inaequalis]
MNKSEDRMILLSEDGEESEDYEHELNRRYTWKRQTLLFSLLLFSGLLNVLQAIWLSLPKTSSSLNHQANHFCRESGQTVSQLLYPPKLYEWTTTSEATDRMMREFDPDQGIVALPKGQPNVLPSEAFPWDDSKEVYVLSGYHSLHSLVRLILFAAIREAGQTRQCRDWEGLNRFRLENSACFKDLGAARHKTPMIEEWQFCPEDSPYKKVVDEYLAQKKKGSKNA